VASANRKNRSEAQRLPESTLTALLPRVSGVAPVLLPQRETSALILVLPNLLLRVLGVVEDVVEAVLVVVEVVEVAVGVVRVR